MIPNLAWFGPIWKRFSTLTTNALSWFHSVLSIEPEPSSTKKQSRTVWCGRFEYCVCVSRTRAVVVVVVVVVNVVESQLLCCLFFDYFSKT